MENGEFIIGANQEWQHNVGKPVAALFIFKYLEKMKFEGIVGTKQETFRKIREWVSQHLLSANDNLKKLNVKDTYLAKISEVAKKWRENYLDYYNAATPPPDCSAALQEYASLMEQFQQAAPPLKVS